MTDQKTPIDLDALQYRLNNGCGIAESSDIIWKAARAYLSLMRTPVDVEAIAAEWEASTDEALGNVSIEEMPWKRGYTAGGKNMLAVLAETGRLSNPLSAGYVAVPKTALTWLFGETDDGNGNWFEPDDGNTKPYWWRTKFRKLIAAAPNSTEEMK